MRVSHFINCYRWRKKNVTTTAFKLRRLQWNMVRSCRFLGLWAPGLIQFPATSANTGTTYLYTDILPPASLIAFYFANTQKQAEFSCRKKCLLLLVFIYYGYSYMLLLVIYSIHPKLCLCKPTIAIITKKPSAFSEPTKAFPNCWVVLRKAYQQNHKLYNKSSAPGNRYKPSSPECKTKILMWLHQRSFSAPGLTEQQLLGPGCLVRGSLQASVYTHLSIKGHSEKGSKKPLPWVHYFQYLSICSVECSVQLGEFLEIRF